MELDDNDLVDIKLDGNGLDDTDLDNIELDDIELDSLKLDDSVLDDTALHDIELDDIGDLRQHALQFVRAFVIPWLLQPALSQSAVFTPTQICPTPYKLMSNRCSRA